MEIKVLKSNDGIPITYYKTGRGARKILIANAPGMSIKFWIPVIQILEKNSTIIAIDYRGFPESAKELTEEECSFNKIVEDFLLIIKTEKLEKFHCLSWCLGTKVILEIYRKMKDTVLSIVTLNSAHKKLDMNNQGKFTGLLLDIKEKVDKDKEAIHRMIKIIDQVGIIPSQNFLAMITEEDEDDESSSLDLYDLLEAESPLASLAFYMINTPNALKTYLKMYVQFGYFSGDAVIKDIEVPFALFTGSEDSIVKFEEDDYNLFKSNKLIRLKEVKGGSHFMIVEYPKKIARMIYESLEENTNLINHGSTLPV
jgi:pimeloyl-ACP methyl ester carboxylesterase